MAFKVEFEFSIDQPVIVNDLKANGTVEMVRYNGRICEYLVTYFCNGKREIEWFRIGEITKRDPYQPARFN